MRASYPGPRVKRKLSAGGAGARPPKMRAGRLADVADLSRRPVALAAVTLLLTLLAAVLIVMGAGRWAGVACLAATVSLATQVAVRGSRRGAFLDGVTGFIFDAALLGAISWVLRGTWAGVAAIIALSLSLFADYLVARARSLGYLMDDPILSRAVRGGLIALALLTAAPNLLWVLAGVCVATVLLRATQVPKQEMAT